MSDASRAKLRRLNAFRRSVPHVSASALAAILDAVDEHGVPEGHSRTSIRRATEAELNVDTPYGPLLKTIDVTQESGTVAPLLIVCPLAMLWRAVAQGGGFTQLVLDALRASPNSPETPWQLILYSDEVTPGRTLITDNRRKIWAVYWSLFEFGLHALCKENAWFCVVAKRTSEVMLIGGGISQVMGLVMKLFFSEPHNLETCGFTLRLPDGNQFRIFVKMGFMIQDGDAHKRVHWCKGDTGMKLCMLCRNLFTEKSEVVGEDGTNLLTCSLIHEADLDFGTTEDIRGSARRLAARSGLDAKGVFENREKAYGFTHNVHSILLDDSLDAIYRPAEHFMHDWMHGMVVHGVFNIIAFLVLDAMSKNGEPDIWNTFFVYLAMWHWPSRFCVAGLAGIFSKKGAKSSKQAKFLKCSGSEGLAIYPVMAYFIQRFILPKGICSNACRAFLACCDVLDYLVSAPLGCVTPEMLRDSIRTLLTFCELSGWRGHMTPKFHWMIHLPRALARFGTLISCFVHERKHKLLKRYCEDLRNTLEFERSIMANVTCHHLTELMSDTAFRFGIHLAGKLSLYKSVSLGVRHVGGAQGNHSPFRAGGFRVCLGGLRGAPYMEPFART